MLQTNFIFCLMLNYHFYRDTYEVFENKIKPMSFKRPLLDQVQNSNLELFFNSYLNGKPSWKPYAALAEMAMSSNRHAHRLMPSPLLACMIFKIWGSFTADGKIMGVIWGSFTAEGKIMELSEELHCRWENNGVIRGSFTADGKIMELSEAASLQMGK